MCVLSLMVSIICRVDWTKKTCADLLGRYFTSVHVRPSVCVVYFILSGTCTRCCTAAWEDDRLNVGVSGLWGFPQLAEVRTA